MPWRETSVGADLSANTVTVFSGATFAPFGSIQDDGMRLRVQGGYGHYRYDATRAVAGAPLLVHFKGIKSLGEVMAGYQLGLGPLTVKAFAGAELEANTIAPADAANPVSGVAAGAKLALETWLNIGDRTFAQLDGGWGSAEGTYSVRLRLGYRALPALSFGPELGALGNRAYDGRRLAGFARYEWATGEVSVSGGVTGSYAKTNDPYGTVSWLTRY
jgi:hypothetical protein